MQLLSRRSAARLCGLLVAAAVVQAAAGSDAQAQSRPAAQVRGASFAHMTLVVADIEKSIDFYQRIGLVKASDRSTSDTDQGGVFGQSDLPLTADSKRSRVVVMSGGNGEREIALLWYDRPPLPSARGNLMGIGTGDVILAFVVPDLQAAYGRLNQMAGGTHFQQPPAHFNSVGVDGSPQSGSRAYAYDPDGNMVEISQLDAPH